MEYRPVNRRPKINLPIPEQLLKDIDAVTSDLGCTRTGFILDCIREGGKAVFYRRMCQNMSSQADEWKGQFSIDN